MKYILTPETTFVIFVSPAEDATILSFFSKRCRIKIQKKEKTPVNNLQNIHNMISSEKITKMSR